MPDEIKEKEKIDVSSSEIIHIKAKFGTLEPIPEV